MPKKNHQFWLKFWGTRGSLPAPRSTTNFFGGNTPCVEVRVEDWVLIFDAGSGIRALGEKLRREFSKVRASLFFSHYHWDHIHGFPFFGPAFAPGNHFTIFGETRGSRSVKDILAGQMALPYFPVPLETMRAEFEYHDVTARLSIPVGPATIVTESLNHPGRSLSYRINYRGKSIVYATDTEHGFKIDERLIRHAEGADLLIYDAAYTEAELLEGKKGWGHSTWQEGVKVAKAAGVRKLLLFHHEPSRDDRAVEALEKLARAQFPKSEAAREGKTFHLIK